MNLHEKMPPVRGTIEYTIYRRGKPIEHVVEHNLVVDGGRNRLAQLISGKSTAAVKYIGFGEGNNLAQLSDTGLNNQQLFEITGSTVDGSDAIFSWYLSETDANSMNICEFRLFSSDTVMLTRQVRGQVMGKNADMTVDGLYTLQF